MSECDEEEKEAHFRVAYSISVDQQIFTSWYLNEANLAY